MGTQVLILQQDDLEKSGIRFSECRSPVTAQIMSTLPFFKDLSLAQHVALSKILEIEYSDGDATVFSQGDIGDTFYILLEGRVGMSRKQLLTGWRVTADEHMSTVTTDQEQPWFGEVALTQHVPCVYTARCDEPCKFFVLRKQFRKFLEICPGFAQIVDQSVKAYGKMNKLRDFRGSMMRLARKQSVAKQKENDRAMAGIMPSLK